MSARTGAEHTGSSPNRTGATRWRPAKEARSIMGLTRITRGLGAIALAAVFLTGCSDDDDGDSNSDDTSSEASDTPTEDTTTRGEHRDDDRGGGVGVGRPQRRHGADVDRQPGGVVHGDGHRSGRSRRRTPSACTSSPSRATTRPRVPRSPARDRTTTSSRCSRSPRRAPCTSSSRPRTSRPRSSRPTSKDSRSRSTWEAASCRSTTVPSSTRPSTAGLLKVEFQGITGMCTSVIG